MSQKDSPENNKKRVKVVNNGGAVYGLGFLGALIYYIQHAHTFWIGVLGVLKALIWPSLLIYKVFLLLKM